ncbi:signal peptide containing protein [Theileria equi strain WA]|uniref:Signal peptide containing protein n=1 Tax=Theileria equi strain WA TaxID=1537102 RepID=L1L9S0_THEEQ|nr:signal peptide containing protein [Theileria equi strain WA]EKX72172.1 signal peptide containing protein [Theileria equi strain WA]|eukprot:XP_004831624.1 signal peptide containing protein [Theileria equi strain WA]
MKIPVLFSFILVSVSGSLLSFGGCGSKSKTNEGEASVAAKNDKAEGRANTEVNNEVVEAAASTVSGDTTDTSAIDISRPETFTAYGTGLGTDGVELKTLHPGTGIRATRVLDNGVKVWEGSGKEKCQTVEFYSKGGSKLLRLLIVVESSYNTGHVYYEHVNEKWKNIKKGVDFDNKLEELKKSENNLSITPGQESLEQEESLEVIPTAPDFKSKLDSTLLIVREYTVDGLFYLTCTPNSNTKVEKLKYDGTEIWSGSATIKKSSNLVDAMIYFDDNAPALIVIHTIKGDERSTVYRYHDGKQWKDTKEDDHNSRLTALKKKYNLRVF